MKTPNRDAPTTQEQVWEALNKAALAAHNQLDPDAIYRAVAHVLLELGLLSSMWYLSKDRQALCPLHTTYAQANQDQFAAKIGSDPSDLCVPVTRLNFWERVLQGETVYLDDATQAISQMLGTDDAALIAWVTEHFNLHQATLLPFFIADQVEGLLLVHGDLGEQSVPTTRAFVSQISSALEHARLYQDAQRRVKELATLQDVSFKLSAALEINVLLEAITEAALEITAAHNCHIYLVDPKGFHFAAARERSGGTTPAVNQPRPDGLVAQVAQKAAPLLINDAARHPLYQTPEARAWHVKAIAGYPLIRSGQVLGVFTLTYLSVHRFDQAEQHVLSLLADQAAAAVERAQLYQDLKRRNQDMSTLYQVALALGAQLNVSDVLDVTYQAIHRATGADTFAIGLYQAANDALNYALIRDGGQTLSPQRLSLQDHVGLTIWVAHNRQELIINDTQKERLPARGVLVGSPVRCWMGFPLIAGDQLVGVMTVQSRQPNAFDAGHQRLCRGIATQVATALEKVSLWEETRQRNWELSVLNKLSAIVSHSFDLETLLDEALSVLLNEMQLDAGAFHLYQEGEQTLNLVSQKHMASDVVRGILEMSVDKGLYQETVSSGKSTIIGDFDRDPRSPIPFLSDYRCYAAIPLAAQDQTVGLLTVLGHRPRELQPHEINLLRAIGQQIGVAVQNTVLYRHTRERERRLRRLYEAARSLSSVLASRTLLQHILEITVSELQAGGALLWLHNDEKDLYPHLALGTLSVQDSDAIAAAAEQVTQVLHSDEGVLWGQRENPQQWVGPTVIGKRGYRAAAPLRGQAQDIGVLEVVTASERDYLTSDDLDFMQTLGGIAAIAYENAQLYQALTQYASSLQAQVETRTSEIRREKEQTEAILRSVADGVFVVDNQSNILLTNPAAEALLDIPQQSKRLHDFIRTVTQQPDSAVPGSTITLKGQTLQARAAKIIQEGIEMGTVIVLHDVTHFEKINHLKSQFVSTVSHELRTPLSNLKLYLSLLEKGRAEKREAYQQVLVQEVNRLENLIQDLLDLSRLEAGASKMAKARLNLYDVVSHVMTILAPQAAAKHITLTNACRAERGDLWLEADRDQMVQMVMNLNANAINYTEPGGQVTLNLSQRTDQHGQWIIFTVQDTGVGIAPGDLPHIWDRFFRGPNHRHMSAGTGLGLSIVQDILEKHAGWITVDSQVGVGSLFTVGLPAAIPPERQAQSGLDQNLD